MAELAKRQSIERRPRRVGQVRDDNFLGQRDSRVIALPIWFSFACVWLVAALLPAPGESAAFIHVVVEDPPGIGFNDPLPFDAVGGNNASSLGEARLRALEMAASVWAGQLQSPVTIEIAARWEPLGGSPSGARFGTGDREGVFKDFAGAPLAATWYPSALANKLAGDDLDGGTAPDARLVFNLDVDGDYALGSNRFYYGLDGAPPPGDVSFLHVALHQIAHALGFRSELDRTTGEKLLGLDDVFITQIERVGASPPDLPSMTAAERLAALQSGSELRWVGPAVTSSSGFLTAGADPGGRVELYAPPTVNVATLHHFGTALAPDQLMEPFYGTETDLTLALAAFQDLGWGPAPQCVTPQDPTPPGLIFGDGFESGDLTLWSNSVGGS